MFIDKYRLSSIIIDPGVTHSRIHLGYSMCIAYYLLYYYYYYYYYYKY